MFLEHLVFLDHHVLLGILVILSHRHHLEDPDHRRLLFGLDDPGDRYVLAVLETLHRLGYLEFQQSLLNLGSLEPLDFLVHPDDLVTQMWRM
jgi:hypothetical protein